MILLIIFLLNIVGLSVSLTWLYFEKSYDAVITSIGLSGSLLISTVEVVKKLNLFYKTRKVEISVLGAYCIGKTVYLSVLLDELQKLQNKVYEFYPADLETIQSVTQSIYQLTNGKWLSPTRLEFANPYKGVLISKGKLGMVQIRLT